MPVSSSSYSMSCLPRRPFVATRSSYGKRALRILVLALQVRVRRRAVEVEPVLLDVLAVVALAVGEAEHPLLEDRVGAVPQRQRQAQPLALVADPGDPVLAPAVGARARLVVGEVVPGVAVLAVVLAHRAPLALAQVRTPRLPRHRAGARLLEALVLGRGARGPRRPSSRSLTRGARSCNGVGTRGSVGVRRCPRRGARGGRKTVVGASLTERVPAPCPIGRRCHSPGR